MDLGVSAADEILKTIDAPIVILNFEGDVVRFNHVCERLSGFKAAEVVGRKVWDFLIPEEEVDAVRKIFQKTRDEGQPTRFVNYWKTKSGARRLIQWSNSVLRDASGDLAYVLAAGVDITEAHEREKALRESRAFLRSIIDASPVSVITIDEAGAILTFSRQAENTFGYEESDVLGKNVAILMPEPDSSRHGGYLRRYLMTGERKIIGKRRQVTARRRNGETFPAILNVAEFQDGKSIFVGFVEDISDKLDIERRLEETKFDLQHAARIGELGEMATSIAHELNQPLTAAASLTGAVSLTLSAAPCAAEHEQSVSQLSDAIREIRRASEIVRQLREFVRKGKTDKRPHDINEIVDEAVSLALIGPEAADLEVVKVYGDNVGLATVDRIQIQQVVTNLIRNALDAMRESERRRLKIVTCRNGDMVEIMIEDSGCGVPPEVKGRLFEPFVTSKPHGTGIGLSISKSIIDAHQGEIIARDNNPTGSVFVVRVPASDDGERSEIS